MSDNGELSFTESEPYPLSLGEQKLLRHMRQLQGQGGNRPYMVTVVVQDGIWHIYHVRPQGAVKGQS